MKLSTKLKNIILVLLAVLLVGNTAVSVYAINALHNVEQGYEDGPETHASSENDVTIAGGYVIRSTERISNAYLDGKVNRLNEKDSETLQMATDILNEIISDDMSDYEKEVAVYEWMIHNLSFDEGSLSVVPDTQEDCDNPYGVLKYHNAVCVGYATTFRLFMQMLEIPCIVVHNSDLYHSWDLVQLDDEWYHVDIFSDENTSGYAHFNLTDEMQSQNETWDTDFFPNAVSFTYNPAFERSTAVKTVCEIPAVMRHAMDNHYESFVIQMPKDFSKDNVGLAYDIIYSIDSSLYDNTNPDYPTCMSSCYSLKSDDGPAFLIVFDYTRESDEPENELELDPKIQAQIDTALQDNFSDLFEVYFDPSFSYDFDSTDTQADDDMQLGSTEVENDVTAIPRG